MPTECIEWKHARTKAGYGLKSINGKLKYVHRLMMEKSLGRELTSKEIVMHMCDNPPCYNLEHLQLGTHRSNHADMVGKKRHAYGSKLPHTKLSSSDIAGIRWFASAGVKMKNIARLYEVDRSHISKIVGGSRRLVLEG